MAYAPLRRKGKGGEVPQLHRRFFRLIDCAGSDQSVLREQMEPAAGGIIADTDTERRRLVPQPMALTTTATMRTAIGSVPISINIETCRAHGDGGWARPYRRPFNGSFEGREFMGGPRDRGP